MLQLKHSTLGSRLGSQFIKAVRVSVKRRKVEYRQLVVEVLESLRGMTASVLACLSLTQITSMNITKDVRVNDTDLFLQFK